MAVKLDKLENAFISKKPSDFSAKFSTLPQREKKWTILSFQGEDERPLFTSTIRQGALVRNCDTPYTLCESWHARFINFVASDLIWVN